MIPQELQNLLEHYCMGMMPTDAQLDEITDKAFALDADLQEVTAMIEELANARIATDKTVFQIVRDEIERLGVDADLNHIDVSRCTTFFDEDDYSGLFEGTDFQGDVSKWNVNRVTDMRSLFSGCKNFNGNLSEWDVSRVTNMNCMFNDCESFNQDLSKWDVGNVTNMCNMFSYCEKFNGNLSNWDVSRVTDMTSMFEGCTKFNRNLGKWDVSRVKYMTCMFAYCSAFNQDLSGWDVSNVDGFDAMFEECPLEENKARLPKFEVVLTRGRSDVKNPGFLLSGKIDPEEQKAREEAEAAKKRQETIEAKKKMEVEASERAFMNIKKIEFANSDSKGDLISGYGKELNDLDIRYLKAQITYDSLLDWDKTITIYVKIIRPDGTLERGSSSPKGYSFSDLITIEKGKNKKNSFSGWGNASKGNYEAGVYQYELWYENKLIFKSSFEVKATKASITINKLFYNNMDKKNAVIICQGVANNIEKTGRTVVLQLFLNRTHFGGAQNNKVYSTTQDVEINKSGEFEARFILNAFSYYKYKEKCSNGDHSCPSYIRWGKDSDDQYTFILSYRYKKSLWSDEFEITRLTPLG